MSRPTGSVPSRKRGLPPSSHAGGVEREFAVLLVGRMRCDDVGAERQRDQQDDEREADDRAAILRERAPELAQRDGGALLGRARSAGSGGRCVSHGGCAD